MQKFYKAAAARINIKVQILTENLHKHEITQAKKEAQPKKINTKKMLMKKI